MPVMTIYKVDNLWHSPSYSDPTCNACRNLPEGVEPESRRIGSDCPPDPPDKEMCPVCFPYPFIIAAHSNDKKTTPTELTRQATKEEKAVCRLCDKPLLPTDPVFRHAALGAPAYGVTGLRSHAACAGYSLNPPNPRKG